MTFYGELLFVWSISCTKISILLFYRRLTAGSATRAFLWGTWIGVAYNICYAITYTIVPINMCRPVDAYWNQFDFLYSKIFSCIDEGLVLPFGAALSTVSDIYGCLLPLLLLRHLQMPTKQKLLLYSLFALGFVVVGSGIVRTYYLFYLFHYTYDVSWDLWDMFIWLILEVYVAIICASAPALKPLYIAWIQSPLTNVYQSYKHGKQSHASSDPSSTSHSYPGKPSRREFEPLDRDTKANEMNIIFVRSDIEMASEVRKNSDAGDDGLVLPRPGRRDDFEGFPSPRSTKSMAKGYGYAV